eukprot:TRINITY_DN1342_c1_g1_i1.p1 TRINITY_DN1342_c1_g1~~TRINITY_DN1342_c1_g1_i1.p1  ORF type:complete len:708 (+),score=212.83 TRINITY_DN1342_c1_g1_i1:61-2184(+)
MGVPSLFQWVFFRFPKAVKAAMKPPADDYAPDDPQAPPPEPVVQQDCLYFDLNSVVHNCCHGSDPLPEDASEDDMILRIFEQVDEIIGVVKPTKLVYFAFDGVVPCGKLVQQRSRRLKTAEEQLKAAAAGSAAKQQGDFDANTISPGTAFMARISEALRWYIHDRGTNDEKMKSLAFILSDASVPGEGEHKIIEYIKQLKRTPGYNPNDSHCICSQDADLVLLGLLLHTPHVTILREYQELRPPRGKQMRFRDRAALKYDFLYLFVMREYLMVDFGALIQKGVDFERILDDFVFLVGLMGNDFLPCIPSILVREGALDELVLAYRKYFAGHFVEPDGRTVNYERLSRILLYYAQKEPYIFYQRKQIQLRRDPTGQNNEGFDFCVENYRAKYDQEKLKGTEMQVSADFLQGLKWVVDYYYTGNASWMWLYPHSYPPLVSSLYHFCQGFHASMQYIYRGPPLQPLELLLCILPRMNNVILPECFRELTQAGAALGDMFEDEHFVEKLAGRHLTITSIIDIKRVLAETRVSGRVERFTDDETRLNTFGVTSAFANVEVHPSLAQCVGKGGAKEAKPEKAVGKKRDFSEVSVEGGGSEAAEATDVAKGLALPPDAAAKFIGLCLTGMSGPDPEGSTPGEDFELSFDLLDPVEQVQTASWKLEVPHVIPHSHPLLPGTELPPKRLLATESVLGSDPVFQSLVAPTFPDAINP